MAVPRKWFKTILVLAVFFAGLYMAALVFLFTQQNKMLYRGPDRYRTPENVGLSQMQELPLTLPESKTGGEAINLTAWWIAPSDTDKPAVMFFHGNGSAIWSNWFIYQKLIENGYGVWAVSYPGYVGASGFASQDNLTRAAIYQYDALLKQGISADKIVFYGTSLGSGVASQLAAVHPPALLIVEAPFTSTADVAALNFPMFPVRSLMRDRWNTQLILKSIHVPMLWMHGTDDRVVPFEMGRKLYDSYAAPKDALIIDGGSHVNVWISGGREFVLGALVKHHTRAK